METMKTHIISAILLSVLALSQPIQLRALSLSANQKLGLGFVAGIATTITTGVLAIHYLNQNDPIMMPPQALNEYLAKKHKNTKVIRSYEQMTVKKGEFFTIERKVDAESRQIWRLYKYPHTISILGIAGKTNNNPEKEDSIFFSFKAKEAGVHTLTFTSTHKPVIPLKSSSNAHMSFISYVTVTVTVEDTVTETTQAASESNTTLDCNPCPIEIGGTRAPTIEPNRPRDLYIQLTKGQEFTVTAHKKADTLEYELGYENLAPHRVEHLEDKDIFYFTAPTHYHGRLRIYLEEHKKDGSKEDMYRIIIVGL